MGRAARAKQAKEVRVKLPEGDFFKCLAKLRTVEVLRLEAREKAARLATEIVQKEIASAEADGRTYFEQLAQKHKFDATLTYRFDEHTCELIATQEPRR